MNASARGVGVCCGGGASGTFGCLVVTVASVDYQFYLRVWCRCY